MKKVLKQWGKSLGIYFDAEDIKIYKLKEGEVLDLSDMIKERKNKGVK